MIIFGPGSQRRASNSVDDAKQSLINVRTIEKSRVVRYELQCSFRKAVSIGLVGRVTARKPS